MKLLKWKDEPSRRCNLLFMNKLKKTIRGRVGMIF